LSEPSDLQVRDANSITDTILNRGHSDDDQQRQRQSSSFASHGDEQLISQRDRSHHGNSGSGEVVCESRVDASNEIGVARLPPQETALGDDPQIVPDRSLPNEYSLPHDYNSDIDASSADSNDDVEHAPLLLDDRLPGIHTLEDGDIVFPDFSGYQAPFDLEQNLRYVEAEEDVTEMPPQTPVIRTDTARGMYIEEYPGASEITGDVGWEHFRLNMQESDDHVRRRQSSPWWPCTSKMEFELLTCLHRLEASEAQIDALLKTEFVCDDSLCCSPT
jgi:hypothetical protein